MCYFSKNNIALLALAAFISFGAQAGNDVNASPAPAPVAATADVAPDVFLNTLTKDVLSTIEADKAMRSGDLAKISKLIETRVMPSVNFQRMTASAVGPAWRTTTAEQKTQLQEEFRKMLMRTYAGALGELGGKTIVVKTPRSVEGNEVVVKTEVKGGSDTIQLDYKMERVPSGGWKIFNINVLGVWLVDNYRSQFSAEINAKGVDGLIASMVERNTPKKS